MEATTANASLHSMNSHNRHDIRRVAINSNVRQQVRDYNRSNSKPGFISKMVNSAALASITAIVTR
jgi:hypothetical protein